MKINKLIIALLSALLLGFFAYFLSKNLEKVEEVIEVGFKGEASTNSLYVSRLFFKAMGIPAQKIALYHLDQLPNIHTVIIINTHRTTLSKKRINALLQWVEKGGHLIAISAPRYLETETYSDTLQAELAIQTQSTYYRDEENEEDDKTNALANSVTVTLPNLDKRYRLSISSFNPLESRAQGDYKIQLDGKTFLIHRLKGLGAVTLISNLKMIENKSIEKHDHAEFLWQLVHLKQVNLSAIWLLNDDDMPPLWKWLWQHASLFLIMLAVLIVVGLYKASHRLGVIIPSESLDRRSILEHIQASAYFFWKYDQQRLIKASRMSVINKLAIVFPEWNHLNDQQKIAQVSEYAQLSTHEVNDLLYSNKKRSPDEFTHLVRQLEQLRKR